MKLKSSHYLIILLTVGGAVAFLAASSSKRGAASSDSVDSDSDPLTEESGRTTDTAQDESSVWYDA